MKELVHFLSNLLKINTTNPPGNELEAAKYIAEWLSERGISCEVLESSPGRGNLIARIEGEKRGPSLLLLGHLDVVPADRSRWKLDPFSGSIKNGYVWGRGALDMKSMVAIEAFVFAELGGLEKVPRGDLVLALTADEERGGKYGVQWILEHERDKVVADYVINEGGGEGILTKKGWLFNVQVAEKGVFWFKVRTKGIPAHGSVPTLGINAIEKMELILSKIKEFKPEVELSEYARRYIEAFLKLEGLLEGRLGPENLDVILDKLSKTNKEMSELFRAMTRVTMTPTIIKGGVKENVVPYECELTVDCRVPPDYVKESVRKLIDNLIGGLYDELEFLQEAEPTWSPIDTPLYNLIVKTLKKNVPGAVVEPYMVTGGTDSRFFRNLGIIAYGFQPLMVEGPFSEWIKLIHGDNERISIKNLEFGYNIIKSVIKEFLYE